MDWLLELDIRYFMIIIIVGGGLFSAYVIWRWGRQDKANAEFWDAIKDPIARLKPSEWGGFHAIKAYTDNVLLAWPLKSQVSELYEMEFGSIVISAGYYQLDLALRGLFVRGALTAGDVFVGGDLVFGIPVVEAHKLESVHGTPPRVVLSSEVVEIAEGHLKFYGDPADSPHNTVLLRDGEAVFINYLSPLIYGSVDVDERGTVLQTHKRQLEAKLVEFSDDQYILSKYQWLAGFHNYVISRWCPEEEASSIERAPLLAIHAFV